MLRRFPSGRSRLLALSIFLLGSCQSVEDTSIAGYKPGDMKDRAADVIADANDGVIDQSKTANPRDKDRTAERRIPGASAPPPAAGLAGGPEPRAATIRPSQIAFDNAPLPAFINAVFAETLKFSVRLDPALATRTETISLRTGDPISGQDLFDIAAAALRDYGIELIVETPRSLRFTTVDRQRGGAPQIFRGGAIGRDAAIGDNPVYYLYSIKATSVNALVTVLSSTFGQKLQITGSPSENAMLLAGAPATISSALELLQSFDQPRMAGKPAVSYDPVYFTPNKLAEALAKILRTAGYGVSTTPDAAAINILPLDEVGTILIFANDENLRKFALDWAKDMDEPRQVTGDGNAFIYFVQNTDVDSVASVISSILGAPPQSRQNTPPRNSAGSLAGEAQAQQPTQQAPSPGNTGAPTVVQAGDMRIAVDPARNALIIMGKADQYATILPLLRQIDRSAGEVLIEVVLAEVTLTDSTSLGVEFDLGNRLRSGDAPIRGGTQGLGLGSSGLTVSLLDAASNAQILINTLSKKNRVNILSNPRVVSKSGSDAHIQVGTQVPVLRQQSSNPGQGQNGITNSVDYIDTGVVLNVRPIIRADKRVDLEVSQEVSEAQTNDTSDISSPLIFTRSISTALSLQDGQTVLLGGLKSQNRSNTRTGVPGLSKIPGLGALFRSESGGKTDTELLVFITPYIVSNKTVSDAVVARYRESMRTWPKLSGSLEW
jgi:general secretion pathway protein D